MNPTLEERLAVLEKQVALAQRVTALEQQALAQARRDGIVHALETLAVAMDRTFGFWDDLSPRKMSKKLREWADRVRGGWEFTLE